PQPPSLLLVTAPGPHPALHSFPTRRSSDLLAKRRRERSAKAGKPRNRREVGERLLPQRLEAHPRGDRLCAERRGRRHAKPRQLRSEEHTSELQSRSDLVCRLLLEKKKK